MMNSGKQWNPELACRPIWDSSCGCTCVPITEILFGSDYQTIHLGIVYPVSKSQTCSLNANLFTAFMNEDETSEKKKNANLIYLRQHIESYRDWLQNDAIGSIKSAEAILNLTSLLRCLSETNQSLSILTSATMLAPPATEIQSIYRQLNTWRDHLIDILINCGTSTCLTIVFNRLNTLTHFVYSNQSDHDQHSLEVVKSKEMLFTKLWPSLSHIRRLNIEQVNQLYEACEKSIIIDKNYVCLMTLVNLNLREVYDFKQIIQHIQKLLDISNSKVENSSSFKSKINRNNLLMGLAMTKKLHHPGLTRSLLKIIFDHDNIPSVIRTLAIRVIGEVHFSQQARNRQTHNSLIYNPYEQQLAEIRTRLIEMLYKLPKKSHDDLLIGQEIFKVLLLSELSVVHLARILSDMAKQERWSFIQICRQFIQQWCKMELLTRDECNCLGVLTLNSAYSTTCQLGLAGGWSGLTGDQSEEIGQATLLQSELSSLNNALLIDYTSYFVLDPYGGLQLSDLCVSVVSKEGESVIFDLSIQADELTSLAPSKKQTTSTTSTSSTGTWLSFDLTYLGISLLPQEVFSGGVVDIVRLLWSSSGQLTPLLQVLKLPIDQRIQTTLTSGWIIQIDNVAALSLSISSGLEASIWKQSGKSHARTQIGLVSEIKINLIQQTDQPTINIQIHNSSFITKGIAIQGYVDFITEIDIKNLPDSVCLLMDQGVDTYVVQWYSIDSSGYFLSDTAISPSARTHDGSGLTADNNKKMYHHSNYTLQPVSYFLGYDNSMKCRK
ncbi:unnamed protein product [Heterobilharzia americana]|nr:unnamed protein product [Heterobilharzia americana]